MTAWPHASHDSGVADAFATIPPDASDIEVYQLYASEMFGDLREQYVWSSDLGRHDDLRSVRGMNYQFEVALRHRL
jgi:hypothetical protein